MTASVASVALSLLGLEPAIEDRAGAAGEDVDRVCAARAPEAPEPPAQLRERVEVARSPGPGIGRRHLERGLDEVGDALEHRFVARERVGVARRELRDLPAVRVPIGTEHEVASVGKRAEGGRIARQQLEPVAVERELADDARSQQAADVARRRDLEAGPRFFRHAGAAEHVATLEHQDLEARPGQVRRGDQPVVAGTDHDDVVRGGGHGDALTVTPPGAFAR